MNQKLPSHGFARDKFDDFATEKIDQLVKKDKHEYILDVDGEYPKELQKKHNKLPFLTERMKIGKVEN